MLAGESVDIAGALAGLPVGAAVVVALAYFGMRDLREAVRDIQRQFGADGTVGRLAASVARLEGRIEDAREREHA